VTERPIIVGGPIEGRSRVDRRVFVYRVKRDAGFQDIEVTIPAVLMDSTLPPESFTARVVETKGRVLLERWLSGRESIPKHLVLSYDAPHLRR
jgi:hypothetical protein